MIGKTISHYKILEELGRGGMGVVYKAQDLKLDRHVALKFLPPHLSQAEEEKKRFIHEAKAASALNHPNIATIYEIDEVDGQLFIAMEYIEGQDLKTSIDNNQLSIDNVFNYAIQIAAGLRATHAKGIIHRDIKPANILLTEDGTVKIVDFGLAKLAGHTMLTKEGTTLGTVAHMSPEQGQGAEVDHRTDIWALGTVLYEMITGQPPFAGDYEQAVMYSIMNENPEPVTALRTGVPMELERMVNKALAKRPDERYQQVTDLLVDLKNLQKSAPSRKSTMRPKAASKAKSKNKTVAAGGVAALLVAASMFWWFRGQEPASPVAVAEQDRKIAVLPFVNITADPEQEYFCDGMTEQLITNLSRIPELKVIARTSVMRYKNTQKDIREISRELNAPLIVEGSVRKSSRTLRVTAQLIQADEGIHLWANDYDQELKDVFAIQDSVSRAIAGALAVTLSGQANKTMAAGYPSNIEAYDYNLQARYYIENIYLKTKKEEDFQHALTLAKRAIELDPEYALGYTGLGYLFENHWIVTGETQDLKQEKAYVEKAYELNPSLPEPNAALGLQFMREGDYDQALLLMKSALQLSAHGWESLHLVGLFSSYVGLRRQAVQCFSKALETNPLGFHTLANRGWGYLLIGDIEPALQDFKEAHRIQPDLVPNLTGYAFALIIKQQYQQADDFLGLAESLPPGMAAPFLARTRALYFAAIGEKDKALSVSKWGGALAVLGMKEEALDLIDDDAQTENFLATYLPLVGLPIYDSLREEPRFQEIVRREKEKYESRIQRYAISLDN
ncbi:MAG: protein kinase [bacterium]